MTIEQVKQAITAGWELYHHSLHHPELYQISRAKEIELLAVSLFRRFANEGQAIQLTEQATAEIPGFLGGQRW